MENVKKSTAPTVTTAREPNERQPEPMEIDAVPELEIKEGKLQNRKRRQRPVEGKSKALKLSWNNQIQNHNTHCVASEYSRLLFEEPRRLGRPTASKSLFSNGKFAKRKSSGSSRKVIVQRNCDPEASSGKAAARSDDHESVPRNNFRLEAQTNNIRSWHVRTSANQSWIHNQHAWIDTLYWSTWPSIRCSWS